MSEEFIEAYAIVVPPSGFAGRTLVKHEDIWRVVEAANLRLDTRCGRALSKPHCAKVQIDAVDSHRVINWPVLHWLNVVDPHCVCWLALVLANGRTVACC